MDLNSLNSVCLEAEEILITYNIELIFNFFSC